jgi:hypothetical protein
VTAHAFVDESKARGFLLAAALIGSADLALARKQVGVLRMPRQRRIHFAKEHDSRRRKIIDALASTEVKVRIYDAGRGDERVARRACLEALVDDLARLKVGMLVLEQDDSLIESDRRILYARVRAVGCEHTLSYEHKAAKQECLLAIPDAVAWCWAKGGEWRRRAEPLVAETYTVRCR